MPTSNIALTSAWLKIAATADTDLLVTFDTPTTIEIATTAADTAPTVMGHRLTRESAITRSVLGTGYVWARTAGAASTVNLVVSK